MIDTLQLIKEIDPGHQYYNLSDIYRRIYHREPDNAHFAESDCLNLLKIAIATNQRFITGADRTAQLFNQHIN